MDIMLNNRIIKAQHLLMRLRTHSATYIFNEQKLSNRSFNRNEKRTISLHLYARAFIPVETQNISLLNN